MQLVYNKKVTAVTEYLSEHHSSISNNWGTTPLLPVSSSSAIPVVEPQEKPAKPAQIKPLKSCLKKQGRKLSPQYTNRLPRQSRAIEQGFYVCEGPRKDAKGKEVWCRDLNFGIRCCEPNVCARTIAGKRVQINENMNIIAEYNKDLSAAEGNLTICKTRFQKRVESYNEWDTPRDIYAV